MPTAEQNRDRQLKPAQLRELLRAARSLNSTLEINTLLKHITEAACRLAQAERATLYVIHHKTNELWTRQMSGSKVDEFRLPLGEGLAGRAAVTGRISNLSDAYRSPHFHRGQDQKTGFRTRALLTVPFRGRDRRLVGVVQVLNKIRGKEFSKADQNAVARLGDFAAMALENAMFVAALQEKKRLEEDLIAARRIQHNLLPRALPTHPRLEIAARYIPCQAVGGDTYDTVRLSENQCGLALGDIVGKGLTAAMMMANLQALFRVESYNGKDPNLVLGTMSNLFYQTTEAYQFATFFYGIIDAATGEMRTCSAGHDPMIVMGPDGKTSEAPLGGPPLGIVEGYEYPMHRVQLEPGSICVVFSDGLTEQHNPRGNQFGPKRMDKAIRECHGRSAEELVNHLEQKIQTFAKGRTADDDFTVLAWKWV